MTSDQLLKGNGMGMINGNWGRRGPSRRRIAPVFLVILLLLLGACGNGAEPEDGEITPLKVTTLGLCNEVQLYWALSQGYFENHGLDVEPAQVLGGAASISALVSDEVDIAYTNIITGMLSFAEGVPLVFVGNSVNTATPPLPEASGMWVRAEDQELQEPTDLEGRTVVTNELGGFLQAVASAWIDRNGGDFTAVDWVALPIPDMVPSLLEGRVDAVHMTSQAVAHAVEDGSIRSIGDPQQGIGGEVVFAGYSTTRSNLEDNPAAFESFFAALQEAQEDIDQPETMEELSQVMHEVCDQDPELIAEGPHLKYVAELNMDVMRFTMETLLDIGSLRSEIDVNELVADFAKS